MEKDEYKNLLIYLHSYTEKTIPRFLDKAATLKLEELQLKDPVETELEYGRTLKSELENALHPHSLMQALDVIDHITKYCKTGSQITKKFTNVALHNTVNDIGNNVIISTNVAEETDFRSVIDNYARPLLEGLTLDSIPKHEPTLYRNLGSSIDPSIEISADITTLKFNKETIVDPESKQGSISKLRLLQDKINKAKSQATDLDLLKGLAVVAKGAAILTANVAFAVGLLDCVTTATESDKSKSVASAILGYGLMMYGSHQSTHLRV